MSESRTPLILALSAMSVVCPVRAQDPPAPADIDALVARFVKTADEYQRVFLNLVAEETKVAENFDQSGALKKGARLFPIWSYTDRTIPKTRRSTVTCFRWTASR